MIVFHELVFMFVCFVSIMYRLLNNQEIFTVFFS